MDRRSDKPRGNFGEKPSTGYPSYTVVPEASEWPVDGYPGLAPPCSFPAGRSPFGVCDMAGNLSEWVVFHGAPAAGDVALGASWLDGEVNALQLGLRVVMPASCRAVRASTWSAFVACDP